MRLLWVDEILSPPAEFYALEDITEVCVASSTAQAKRLLQEQPFELCLISDSMTEDPLVLFPAGTEDGLEIAILGHAPSFSFAKRAMARNCCGYLTYPISGEALRSVICRMIGRVRQKQAVKHWEERRLVVQNAFWQALVDRRIPAAQVRDAAKRYDVSIPAQVFPVYLRCRNPNLYDGECAEDGSNFMTVLLHPSYFSPLEVQVVSLGHYALLFLIFGAALSPEAVRGGCEQMLDDCRKNRVDTVCMLGKACTCMELVEQVMHMQQAGQNQVYLDNHLLPNTPGQLHVTTPPQPNTEKLLTLLDCGMFAETMETAKAFFFNPDVVPQINAHFLENYKYQLLDGLRNLELVRKSGTDIFVNIPTELMTQAGTSIQDFLELLQAICTVLDRMRTAEHDQRSLAEEIKIHILEHLDDTITRNSIAERFYVSADHLDRVFKREFGKTVTDYIQQERITLAKQLLAGSNLSVSEVAAKVGFVNFSHFSSVFKKSTGLAPFLYRKQHTAE